MSRADRLRTAGYSSPFWLFGLWGWSTLNVTVAVIFGLSLIFGGIAWISEGKP